MKGYSRIGVGVRPDKDPNSDPVMPVHGSSIAIASEMTDKTEGLGYGIELDQYDLRELEMDRGEGSSSSSGATREVVLNSLPMETTPTLPESDMPVTPPELETETEMPDVTELRRMADRLNAGPKDADRDELVGMVRSVSRTDCATMLISAG